MLETDKNETPQGNGLNEENPQQNPVTEHHSPDQATPTVKPLIYADESWSFLRFAWEFLRLKDEFKTDCDKAINTKLKREVARKYGLKHFVHYAEEFDTSQVKIRFNGADISSWTNISTNKDKKIAPDRRLKQGEVAIYFDLNFMLKEPVKSLEKQLEKARKTLSRRLASYARRMNKSLQERTLTNQKEKPILAYNVYIDFNMRNIKKIDSYISHKNISRDQFDTSPNLARNCSANATRAYKTAESYITNDKYRELALFSDPKIDTIK